MTGVALALILALAVILVSCELFTNALEHLGEHLGISDGVTGSIFAAVATALPETVVPLLALAGGADGAKHDIATGAILGAPLMLSTLTMCLMGLAAAPRGLLAEIRPEPTGLRRDLNTFLAAFTLAAAALWLPPGSIVRPVVAVALVAIYGGYLWRTVRASRKLAADGHATEAGAQLMLARAGLPDGLPTVVLQALIALGLLLAGAEGFIHGVEAAARLAGVSALLLSLVAVPVATELPEKINSILWVRRGKDTLATGNITGAMTFQSTLLPAIGISLTDWTPEPRALAAFGVALAAGVWLRILAAKRIRVAHLLLNGCLYAGFIIWSLR